MLANVPALPYQVTSMRLAPIAASVSVAPATRISRISTAQGEPHRNGTVDEDRGDADEEQQAVGDRVEDLAEVGRLVEVARDVAVGEVGRAEQAEQPRGRGAVLLVEEQPQEHGQAEQPKHGDGVGDSEHSVVCVSRPRRPVAAAPLLALRRSQLFVRLRLVVRVPLHGPKPTMPP